MSATANENGTPPEAPRQGGKDAAAAVRKSQFLDFGFRPFFLLCGFYAVLSMVAWILTYQGVLDLGGALPASYWHGHEMLFGFAMAAVAGFLLTAVPTWTGTKPVSGAGLAVLAALWVLGRAAMWLGDALPPVAVAGLDLSLIPALGLVVGRAVVAKRQFRNAVFPALLAVLFAANLLVHLEALGITEDSAALGLRLGLYVFTVMVAVLGSRMIPAFTRNALASAGIEAEVRSGGGVQVAALVALVAAVAADLADAPAVAQGVLALGAALLLAASMRGWQTRRVLGQPILWVMHLAYAWLPVGFALKGLADLTGMLPPTAALHGMTTGAIGTMILAMTTRVALGHTGRALKVAPPITVAYVLVTLAALLRVAAPLAAPGAYVPSIVASGLFWAAAFAIFTVVYWPILTGPRAGEP